MKRATVTYTEALRGSPVTYWAHHRTGGPHDPDRTYDPPLPGPVPGKGWLRLMIEFGGHELTFSSAVELDHVIEVLSRTPIPTSLQLSREHGAGAGPNQHWLSRFPAGLTRRRTADRLVEFLRSSRPPEWKARAAR